MSDTVNRNITGAFDTIYIRDEAIETLENHLVMADFATSGEIPRNRGSILRFQIDANPTKNETTDARGQSLRHALTANDGPPGLIDDTKDGITWAERADFNRMNWTSAEVEKQIHSYGGFVPVRNVDLDDMPRSTMQRLAERLGFVGVETLDTLLRMAVDGTSDAATIPGMGTGTTVVQKSIGDGTVNTVLTTTDQLTAEDIALATGVLWGKNVRPFSNGYFAQLVHSLAATHLVTDVSTARLAWERMNRYISGFSGQEKLTAGHLGAIVGTMIIRTNSVSVEAAGGGDAEGYNNLLLGKDALGNVHRDDLAPEIMINRPNENSTDNPFRIYATAAFYFQAGPVLLDEDRCLIMRSATGS